MRQKTEEAFKEADHVARLLGDMKHGIYEVRSHGGLDEKIKLETLMGFRTKAEDLLKILGDKIAIALDAIDKETKLAGVGGASHRGTHTAPHCCVYCGEPYPEHDPKCEVFAENTGRT